MTERKRMSPDFTNPDIASYILITLFISAGTFPGIFISRWRAVDILPRRGAGGIRGWEIGLTWLLETDKLVVAPVTALFITV
jgi:hypothetical protein